MVRLKWIGSSLAMLIILILTIPVTWAADEIRIGVIGPMRFSYGQEQWNGAELAADEINAAGGIQVGDKKMPIKLFKADSAEFFSVAAAATAMEKLILKDKCHFVMGGLASEASLAMQDVAMDHKTIFYSCGPATPELCNRVAENYSRYKYYFRGAPFNSNYLLRGVIHQLRSVTVAMKKQMAVDNYKVALLIEKGLWADPMVQAYESLLPKMGLEIVGTWRPQPTSKDLTAELKAIEASGCNIILSAINGPAGITLGRQYGELKIPAVLMGIISQAGMLGYADATQGMGDYVMTYTMFTQDLEINDLTKPFVDGYFKRYHEVPQYTALTHTIIKYQLKEAIEKVGSLDPEALIPCLESSSIKFPGGVSAFSRDELGRPTHDPVWGPNYASAIAAQWQQGKLVPVWPYFKWMSPYWEFSVEPSEDAHDLSIKGLVPFKIAPWVLAAYNGKELATH